MKLLLTVILGCFLVSEAHASILLTTPYSLGGPSNAIPNPGTALSATVTGKQANYLTNQYCLTYSFGTVAKTGSQDTGFTVLAGAPTIQSCLNTVTGSVIASRSDGQQIYSVVLTGVGLTNAIAVYTGPDVALRNAGDLFASTTFLPGTQPDTW